MNKVISLLLLICFSGISFAQQQVGAKEALIVGLRLMNQIYKENVEIDTMYSYLGNNQDTLMYQITTKDGYYVLVSGSYACVPLLSRGLGESPKPLWEKEDAPPALNLLINSYIEQIEECFTNDTISLHYLHDWNSIISDNYLDKTFAPKDFNSYIHPLVSTQWGQSHSNNGFDLNAYNYYCPSSNCIGYNCPTGCGATAMAQILNYWRYPVYDYKTNRQLDWCNMTDALDANSHNYVNEREAVAYLMAKCGEISQTSYCDSGDCSASMSLLGDIKDGLYSMGYRGIQVNRVDTIEGWCDFLKVQLSLGMPMLYRVADSNNNKGHLIICDGYDEEGLFHFNWGWNGRYNDQYYRLDSINSYYDYSYYHSVIAGIAPKDSLAEAMREMCTFDISLIDHYLTYYILCNLSEYEPWENVINTTDDLVSIPIDERYPSSWRTIPSGESSEYVAHKSITLQPGFHAERGSTFTARIVPCSNCDSEEMSSLTQQTMMPGGGNSEDSSMLSKSVVADSNNEEMSDNRLFPNPSHETITYQGKEVASMGIYDMTGKAVYRWFIVSKSENEIVVNIKDLRPSMYVLLLNMSDGTREVVRFIKE